MRVFVPCFCLVFFKVRLRMPHVVGAKRRLTKIFECLEEMITRLVRLIKVTDSVAMDINTQGA